jgi:hypothetical protein
MEAAAPLLARKTGGLPAVRRSFNISYGPYGYPVPARVFVGSDDQQMLGVKVLHYSIDKHSSMDVVVEPLDWRAMPVPKDPKNRSRTGFSFCRFDIPRLCGFAGRGIYVDADMQVFTDITDLWTLPLEEADLLYALTHPSQGRTPQTSVMLINCEKLRWDVHEIIAGLDEERYSYKELMSDLCLIPKGRAQPLIPYWWNSLEIYEPGRTSLIHYTDMHTQPWISHANKNGEVWYRTAAEAVRTGFISVAEVEEAVELGHISPRIFDWIGEPAPKNYAALEATWVAPFNRFWTPKRPEGSVTLTADGRLVGWAWDPARPDEPIDVGLYDGDRLVRTITCADFGKFLAAHGKGSGRHAFDVPLPSADELELAPELHLRILDGDIPLLGSPVAVQ